MEVEWQAVNDVKIGVSEEEKTKKRTKREQKQLIEKLEVETKENFSKAIELLANGNQLETERAKRILVDALESELFVLSVQPVHKELKCAILGNLANIFVAQDCFGDAVQLLLESARLISQDQHTWRRLVSIIEAHDSSVHHSTVHEFLALKRFCQYETLRSTQGQDRISEEQTLDVLRSVLGSLEEGFISAFESELLKSPSSTTWVYLSRVLTSLNQSLDKSPDAPDSCFTNRLSAFDYLFGSSSSQENRDAAASMSEIYRICKTGQEDEFKRGLEKLYVAATASISMKSAVSLLKLVVRIRNRWQTASQCTVENEVNIIAPPDERRLPLKGGDLDGLLAAVENLFSHFSMLDYSTSVSHLLVSFEFIDCDEQVEKPKESKVDSTPPLSQSTRDENSLKRKHAVKILKASSVKGVENVNTNNVSSRSETKSPKRQRSRRLRATSVAYSDITVPAKNLVLFSRLLRPIATSRMSATWWKNLQNPDGFISGVDYEAEERIVFNRFDKMLHSASSPHLREESGQVQPMNEGGPGKLLDLSTLVFDQDRSRKTKDFCRRLGSMGTIELCNSDVYELMVVVFGLFSYGELVEKLESSFPTILEIVLSQLADGFNGLNTNMPSIFGKAEESVYKMRGCYLLYRVLEANMLKMVKNGTRDSSEMEQEKGSNSLQARIQAGLASCTNILLFLSDVLPSHFSLCETTGLFFGLNLKLCSFLVCYARFSFFSLVLRNQRCLAMSPRLCGVNVMSSERHGFRTALEQSILSCKSMLGELSDAEKITLQLLDPRLVGDAINIESLGLKLIDLLQDYNQALVQAFSQTGKREGIVKALASVQAKVSERYAVKTDESLRLSNRWRELLLINISISEDEFVKVQLHHSVQDIRMQVSGPIEVDRLLGPLSILYICVREKERLGVDWKESIDDLSGFIRVLLELLRKLSQVDASASTAGDAEKREIIMLSAVLGNQQVDAQASASKSTNGSDLMSAEKLKRQEVAIDILMRLGVISRDLKCKFAETKMLHKRLSFSYPDVYRFSFQVVRTSIINLSPKDTGALDDLLDGMCDLTECFLPNCMTLEKSASISLYHNMSELLTMLLKAWYGCLDRQQLERGKLTSTSYDTLLSLSRFICRTIKHYCTMLNQFSELELGVAEEGISVDVFLVSFEVVLYIIKNASNGVGAWISQLYNSFVLLLATVSSRISAEYGRNILSLWACMNFLNLARCSVTTFAALGVLCESLCLQDRRLSLGAEGFGKSLALAGITEGQLAELGCEKKVELVFVSFFLQYEIEEILPARMERNRALIKMNLPKSSALSLSDETMSSIGRFLLPYLDGMLFLSGVQSFRHLAAVKKVIGALRTYYTNLIQLVIELDKDHAGAVLHVLASERSSQLFTVSADGFESKFNKEASVFQETLLSHLPKKYLKQGLGSVKTELMSRLPYVLAQYFVHSESIDTTNVLSSQEKESLFINDLSHNLWRLESWFQLGLCKRTSYVEHGSTLEMAEHVILSELHSSDLQAMNISGQNLLDSMRESFYSCLKCWSVVIWLIDFDLEHYKRKMFVSSDTQNLPILTPVSVEFGEAVARDETEDPEGRFGVIIRVGERDVYDVVFEVDEKQRQTALPILYDVPRKYLRVTNYWSQLEHGSELIFKSECFGFMADLFYADLALVKVFSPSSFLDRLELTRWFYKQAILNVTRVEELPGFYFDNSKEGRGSLMAQADCGFEEKDSLHNYYVRLSKLHFKQLKHTVQENSAITEYDAVSELFRTAKQMMLLIAYAYKMYKAAQGRKSGIPEDEILYSFIAQKVKLIHLSLELKLTSDPRLASLYSVLSLGIFDLTEKRWDEKLASSKGLTFSSKASLASLVHVCVTQLDSLKEANYKSLYRSALLLFEFIAENDLPLDMKQYDKADILKRFESLLLRTSKATGWNILHDEGVCSAGEHQVRPNVFLRLKKAKVAHRYLRCCLYFEDMDKIKCFFMDIWRLAKKGPIGAIESEVLFCQYDCLVTVYKFFKKKVLTALRNTVGNAVFDSNMKGTLHVSDAESKLKKLCYHSEQQSTVDVSAKPQLDVSDLVWLHIKGLEMLVLLLSYLEQKPHAATGKPPHSGRLVGHAFTTLVHSLVCNSMLLLRVLYILYLNAWTSDESSVTESHFQLLAYAIQGQTLSVEITFDFELSSQLGSVLKQVTDAKIWEKREKVVLQLRRLRKSRLRKLKVTHELSRKLSSTKVKEANVGREVPSITVPPPPPVALQLPSEVVKL